MYFNTAADHCTDNVALGCIVNVFTACKTHILLWDTDYSSQSFNIFPLSIYEGYIFNFLKAPWSCLSAVFI